MVGSSADGTILFKAERACWCCSIGVERLDRCTGSHGIGGEAVTLASARDCDISIRI